ncbi:MAG TPA: type II secretion system protein N [Burkholderiales bacterium]|nr:type II secretion system protein N [Burkholderiales bacterium]
MIVLAPATLIDARLERASDGRLRLASAEGSLWSGAGWIEIRDADGRAGVARRLAWRVLPESLLRGRLVAEVELDQAAKPFSVTISLSRMEIADASINLPAAALGLGMPRLAPFRLTGEVRVNIPHLSLERGRMDGDATLQWRAAGSALTPISPLGEYEVHFKAVGPAVHAALRTLEGPLQLEGKGTWSNGAPPSYVATARVPAQQQEQLAPLLSLIAVERGAGSFELNSNKMAFGP